MRRKKNIGGQTDEKRLYFYEFLFLVEFRFYLMAFLLFSLIGLINDWKYYFVESCLMKRQNVKRKQ